MNIQEFPHCCGTAIISALHAPGRYASPDPNMEDQLKQYLNHGIGKDSYNNGGWVGARLRHVAIIITVARQTQAIALIKKYKGKAVGRFTNRNTGDVNTVWMLPTRPDSKFSRVSC